MSCPPARASDAYLVRTFDDFADTFDSVLGRLEYRAPQRVCGALLAMLGEAGDQLRVLDAGCGTGLCGPLLRERAHRLTGVDLAPKMIEHARKRGCYDDLEVAELTQFLAAHPGSLDAVVSADTLCYFGDLAPVFEAMRDALESGGCFAFTVERADASGQGDWTLAPSGRYAHRVGYLKRALGEAGLKIESCVPTVLRLEAGEDVQGYIVTGRKP